MTLIKALSLWEPWGSLMGLSLKRVETRDAWVDRVKYRGLVAIHTASEKTQAFRPSDYDPTQPFMQWMQKFHDEGILDMYHLPYSNIIAVGEWVETVSTESIRDTLSPQELAFGDYRDGRRGLLFKNMRRLATPIPISGHQGFWNWDMPEDLQFLPADYDKVDANEEAPVSAPIVIQPASSSVPIEPEPEDIVEEVADAPMPRVHTGDGLLHLDDAKTLRYHINDLIGFQLAILGIKGSGKSYTARLLAEEMLRYIPMTIIDIDGEYYTLREKFPQIVVMGGDHGQPFGIARDDAAHSFRLGVSTILDFSNMDSEQMFEYLLEYFDALWRLSNRVSDRKPYGVLIEEAHEFIPQRSTTPIAKKLVRLAGRGRKRGFTVIYVSQRSEKVDKNSLTASDIYFLHRVSHPADVGTYAEFVPLKPKEVRQLVVGLKTGQAVVLHGETMQTVMMRKATTTHKGATPKLTFAKPPDPPEPVRQPIIQPPDPVEVAFNQLLAETVCEWAERLAIEVEHVKDDYHVTVYFNGQSVTYTTPCLAQEDAVADTPTITPRNASSALWATTSVLWSAPTLEQFCMKFRLVPTDPLAIERFETWRDIARKCTTMFGLFWGNDRKLREIAAKRVNAKEGISA